MKKLKLVFSSRFSLQSCSVLSNKLLECGNFPKTSKKTQLSENIYSWYKWIIIFLDYNPFKRVCISLHFQPENVVCVQPKSTRIKLIDFGLARQLENGKETKITCGTPEFVGKKISSSYFDALYRQVQSLPRVVGRPSHFYRFSYLIPLWKRTHFPKFLAVIVDDLMKFFKHWHIISLDVCKTIKVFSCYNKAFITSKTRNYQN